METDEPKTGGQPDYDMERALSVMQATADLSPFVEIMKQICEEVGQKLREWAEWASGVLREMVADVIPTINAFTDQMLSAANDNPRWWYLYKHAKRYRTRKKYRRLLTKQLIKKLEADEDHKEANE